jgi:hypothetical protein
MDSTSLGATRTWIDTDGEEGTGSGQYDGSNTNTGGSISWQKYDETNDEIDFKSIRNDNVKTAITKDITVSNNGMNEALSTSKWIMRFKVRFDTFQSGGDTNIKPRLTSFDRNTASNNDNYTGGDGFSVEFYNASTPFVRFGWGRNEQVDQNNIGSDVTISASAQTFFIEVNRDGTTLTCKCSTSAYGSTDVFNKSGTVDSDWGDSGTPLKYFGLWEGSGTGQTAYLQGAVHDIQVYNGVSSLDGCKNDASSTSELDGMTNLPVNTIFEQTDDSPTYWWKQSDNTWALDGTTEISYDFSTDQTTGKAETGDDTVRYNSTNGTWDYKTTNGSSGGDNAGNGWIDLGSVLPDKWICRWHTKQTQYTSYNNNSHVGFWLHDSTGSTSHPSGNCVGLRWYFGAQWGGGDNSGTSAGIGIEPRINITSTSPHDNTNKSSRLYGSPNKNSSPDLYHQMSFDKSTGTQVYSLYSDSDYKTQLVTSTQSASSNNGTPDWVDGTPTDITGLRYIMIHSVADGSKGNYTLAFDNIKIQKGRTTWLG